MHPFFAAYLWSSLWTGMMFGGATSVPVATAEAMPETGQANK